LIAFNCLTVILSWSLPIASWPEQVVNTEDAAFASRQFGLEAMQGHVVVATDTQNLAQAIQDAQVCSQV
jgi:hypothetical protein